MNKLFFGAIIASAFALGSCCWACGDKEEKTTHADHEAEHSEEEESTIAFDGVDKGDYVLYGHSEISASDAATVPEMLAEMESTGKFSRKVTVSIAQVCQKAGCWITFDDSKGGEIRVFFRDHFTIPTETVAGTEAILYGNLIVDTLSIDFQKHLLDDAKDDGQEVAQSEYDAITADIIETTFDCESILVKK